MCSHKHRLSKEDRDFLFQARITPYDCHICEQIAKRAEDLRGKPRLRLEQPPEEDMA